MAALLPASTAATPVLEIDGLQLVFPVYDGEVKALNQVSLRVNAGEIVGVVGESGSGKSVTAMMAMRLLPPESFTIKGGSLHLLGSDVLQASEKQMRQLRGARVAMIFQEPMNALNPTRKIGRQMCEIICLHQQLSRQQAHNKAVALLQEMQIADAEQVMARYPFELSGGMRQRVLIAMAFSCEPELIIADEPTTALDVTVQRQVLRLLQRKALNSGTAVLFITHDMAVVAQLCDRVYVMYAGHVIESGGTEQVIGHPAHPYSIGLLQAAPENAEPRTLLKAIAGTVPSLTHLPQGCAFRERCSHADARCMQTPPLTPMSAGSSQQVACWHPQPGNLPSKQEQA
ncbi:ABC transporter ATP-binding protein [Rahnella sp. SAP-1]|uniref:ABC transporter ATP-binding protein n=1 Tax=Rouxiella aceris TaxID=2703884 RepID=A0A848MJE8_9GAMM|nr:ABC transporter ATP-binding protein [Rouxiella aceris]NMP27416.1 ABC transporter ATP-binding protein [Rouxiella aceris]